MIFSFGLVDRFVVSGFPSPSDVVAISATRGRSKTAATDLGNCLVRVSFLERFRVRKPLRSTESRTKRGRRKREISGKTLLTHSRRVRGPARVGSSLSASPLPHSFRRYCRVRSVRPKRFVYNTISPGIPVTGGTRRNAIKLFRVWRASVPCKTHARPPPRTRGRLQRTLVPSNGHVFGPQLQFSTANEKRPSTHRPCDTWNPRPTFGDAVNWRLSEETNE